jgi:prolyl oligopeptidase
VEAGPRVLCYAAMNAVKYKAFRQNGLVRGLTCAAAVPLLLLASGTQLQYPAARRSAQVDDYHGTKVADPYRWLEDADSPETAAWVAAENKLTREYLARIPERTRIREHVTRLVNFETYSNEFGWGGRYFVSHNSGLQNQYVMFTMGSAEGEGRVIIDPNTLHADGTAALTGTSVSRNGRWLAYGIAQAGSDWSDLRIRDLNTGKDRDDVIHWTKFSDASWIPDSSGFYYSRFPEPAAKAVLTATNLNARVYRHILGQPQSADKLVYADPAHPKQAAYPEVTEDGHYAILTIDEGDAGKNAVFYEDLRKPGNVVVKLIPNFVYLYSFIGSIGSEAFFYTTDGAPKERVIAIDLNHPDRQHWKEIVAEKPETIDTVILAGGKLLVSYMKDAHSAAKLYSSDGRFLRDVSLPGLGTAYWSSAEQKAIELFYSFATFTSPPSIYRFNLNTGQSELIHASKLNFDPTQYVTEQVFYHSKDGTRVPMFLVHSRGINRNGRNPVLLYGYGGFNIALTPWFSSAHIAWMDMGGIFAVANLRGGSEYGEAWHLAGTKLHKQNVFDDFIAAAQWLISNRYTSPDRLAIEGESNGGLLMGAVVNQQPHLFGAVLAGVGVMDMLRYDKFTAGVGWVGDYGSPDNPQEFRALLAYSPLQNIRPGTHYPAVLVTTADHDDRVVPGHSFKYTATLQAAQAGSAPILIRVETRAGHGGGEPRLKLIDLYADQYAFVLRNLKMSLPNTF